MDIHLKTQEMNFTEKSQFCRHRLFRITKDDGIDQKKLLVART